MAGHRLGAISSVAAGVLFLVRAVLELTAGDPPADDTELLAWVDAHRLALTLVNESLAFLALLLVPVVLALYQRHGGHRPWVAFGCAVLATTVPLLLALAVVHGRLVYPVYGIEVDDPAILGLVVSLYYGGVHEVTLLFGLALLVLGTAMWHGGLGRAASVFGIAAGAAQFAGAFPWIIGPLPASITQAALAAWLVFVGVRLAAD